MGPASAPRKLRSATPRRRTPTPADDNYRPQLRQLPTTTTPNPSRQLLMTVRPLTTNLRTASWSPRLSIHLLRVCKNSCRPNAEIVDVDQPGELAIADNRESSHLPQ